MREAAKVPQDDWDNLAVAMMLKPIEEMLRAASNSADFAARNLRSEHCADLFGEASKRLATLMETDPVLSKLKHHSLPMSLLRGQPGT